MLCNSQTATGTPSSPPKIKTTLSFHSMFLRKAQRFVACTPTLHAIINGTASIGGKIWSKIAPATAENAKPAKPETKAPKKTAPLSTRNDSMLINERPPPDPHRNEAV